MAKFIDLLNFLDTLILSIAKFEDTVKINKITLVGVQTCLQDAQGKIELLQLKSQFQQEYIQHNRHHFDLFFF